MKIKQIKIHLRNNNLLLIKPMKIQSLVNDVFNQIRFNSDCIDKLPSYSSEDDEQGYPINQHLENDICAYRLFLYNTSEILKLNIDNQQYNFPMIEIEMHNSIDKFRDNITIIFEDLDDKLSELNIEEFIRLVHLTYSVKHEISYNTIYHDHLNKGACYFRIIETEFDIISENNKLITIPYTSLVFTN